MEVVPRERELDPGGSLSFEIRVKDAAGRPVEGAEVALAVVDEAVLALSGHRWPDPLEFFHPERREAVERLSGRSYVGLASDVDLEDPVPDKHPRCEGWGGSSAGGDVDDGDHQQESG